MDTNNNNNQQQQTTTDNDDPNHQERVSVRESAESENVKFLEKPLSYAMDIASSPDNTFSETGAKDGLFEGFLDRYIEIDNFEWTIGTDLLEIRDPWSDWASNPRIKEKLKFFRYMKMELEVRFIINGTPFHYGQIMAAYAPMLAYWGHGFDTPATATANYEKSSLYNFRHNIDTSGSVAYLKELTDSYFSTFPHVMIIPGENHPVEMTLPFIWHNNYLRVNKTNAVYSDGTTGRETPGSLVFTDLVGLQRASDTASNKVDVTVWVRAKNIDLNTPTSATAASEMEEASKPGGFVSNMATGAADAAKVVGKIPMLAPYAKATEVAADAVGSVAKLFGFSKPSDPKSADPLALNNGKNIAVTNTSDNSQRLTFDVNQELSVDSRVIGSDGKDDMSFQNIATRWWWAAKCPWIPSASSGSTLSSGFDVSEPKLLYRACVSPMTWRHAATSHTTSKDAWQLCPSGLLASTFKFWRGSIVYRIQVVASKYHTGRIKIQFDPYNSSSTVDHVETRFTWILDLSESREIEVTIPFVSHKAYLETIGMQDIGLQDPQYSISTTSSVPTEFNEELHTGILSVSIVNHLVSPNAANGPVTISVWQKMGDDFDFQVPSSDWHNKIIQATAASSYEKNDENKEEELIGASANPIDMWKHVETPERTSVFFGEKVSSIRTLVKRSMYMDSLVHQHSTTGPLLVSFTLPHWPIVSKSGWNLKNSYVSYFSPAFLAKRGGMRYKLFYWFTKDSNNSNVPNGYYGYKFPVQVERNHQNLYKGYTTSDIRVGGTSASNFTQHCAGGSTGGVIAAGTLGDNLVELESPYYQDVRFQLATWIDESLTPIDTGSNYMKYTQISAGDTSTVIKLGYYAAAAEDFSLMFFLAAPVLYSS